MDSLLLSASLDHFSSIQKGEVEMKLCTPPPSLIAVAFSTFTPKATGDGGVVKEWEGNFPSIMEVDRPVGPAMHHELYTTGL